MPSLNRRLQTSSCRIEFEQVSDALARVGVETTVRPRDATGADAHLDGRHEQHVANLHHPLRMVGSDPMGMAAVRVQEESRVEAESRVPRSSNVRPRCRRRRPPPQGARSTRCDGSAPPASPCSDHRPSRAPRISRAEPYPTCPRQRLTSTGPSATALRAPRGQSEPALRVVPPKRPCVSISPQTKTSILAAGPRRAATPHGYCMHRAAVGYRAAAAIRQRTPQIPWHRD